MNKKPTPALWGWANLSSTRCSVVVIGQRHPSSRSLCPWLKDWSLASIESVWQLTRSVGDCKGWQWCRLAGNRTQTFWQSFLQTGPAQTINIFLFFWHLSESFYISTHFKLLPMLLGACSHFARLWRDGEIPVWACQCQCESVWEPAAADSIFSFSQSIQSKGGSRQGQGRS